MCWLKCKAKGKALAIVEELIYSHAVGIDSVNAAPRQWSALQNHRARLAELRSTLKQEVVREVGYFERGRETLEMQRPDGPSADRNAWAAAAGAHGREVYRADDNGTDAQLQRLTRLQQLAHQEMAQG